MLVPAVLLVLRRETGIPHPINRPSERATLTLTGTLRKPENNKLRMNRSNPSRIYFGFSLHSRPAPDAKVPLPNGPYLNRGGKSLGFVGLGFVLDNLIMIGRVRRGD